MTLGCLDVRSTSKLSILCSRGLLSWNLQSSLWNLQSSPSDLKIPEGSHIGVITFGRLFMDRAHKAGQKVAPPPAVIACFFFHLFVTSGNFNLYEFFLRSFRSEAKRVHAWLLPIRMTALIRVAIHWVHPSVSWCTRMQLCSQGPHLWPFISSQVKGLRDNEAHLHTDTHCWSEEEQLLVNEIEHINAV